MYRFLRNRYSTVIRQVRSNPDKFKKFQQLTYYETFLLQPLPTNPTFLYQPKIKLKKYKC